MRPELSEPAIGLFLTLTQLAIDDPLILAGICTTLIGAVYIWYKMAARWWSIQHVAIKRMRDIAKELGFLYHEYVTFKDNKREYRWLPCKWKTTTLTEDIQKDIGRVRGYNVWGPRTYSKWLIILIWIASSLLVILKTYPCHNWRDILDLTQFPMNLPVFIVVGSLLFIHTFDFLARKTVSSTKALIDCIVDRLRDRQSIPHSWSKP